MLQLGEPNVERVASVMAEKVSFWKRIAGTAAGAGGAGLAGGIAGGVIGSLFGPVGTIIGAKIGAGLCGVTGAVEGYEDPDKGIEHGLEAAKHHLLQHKGH